MLIKFKKASDVKPSEITSKAVYLDRRRFLKTAAVAGAGVAFGSIAPPVFAAPNPRVKLSGVKQSRWNQKSLGEELTEYGPITKYNNFYEFGTGKTDPAEYSGDFKTKPWSLAVEGAVEKPGVYDLEDFIKPHQLEERVYRMRCVEAWSMVIPWVGISLGDVITMLFRLLDPNFQPVLAPPWDLLNSINLSNLKLSFNTRKGVGIQTQDSLNIQLPFVEITSVQVWYGNPDGGSSENKGVNGKESRSTVYAVIEGKVLGVDIPDDDSWDMGENSAPDFGGKGLGAKIFKLDYIGLGQHIKLTDPPETLLDVIDALKRAFAG